MNENKRFFYANAWQCLALAVIGVWATVLDKGIHRCENLCFSVHPCNKMARGSMFSVLIVMFVYPMLFKVHTSGIVRQQASNTIIKTEYGDMRGLLVEFPDLGLRPVQSYLGIQYASTMASQMRFMPPTSSPEKWKGTRSVSMHRPVCPQNYIRDSELRRIKPVGEAIRLRRILEYVKNDGLSEECLNLNLYVPGNRGRLQ